MGASLRKRGDTWYCWVPRKDGRGRRLVSTRCTDKRAAEVRAGELERQAVDPAHRAAVEATLAGACGDFISSRRSRGRADGTLHHYGVKLSHIVRLLPAALADASHAECERYIATRLEEGAAQTTIKKELRALKAVLRHARRNEKFMRDPDAVVPEFEDTYRPRERWLTPLELVGLATALPPHRMAVVAFACATGCDRSAIWRAKASDVLPNLSAVFIHGTKRATRERLVPIVMNEQRALLKWALANADGGIGGRLFSAWPNLANDVAKACAKIGIPRCSPNDWRRTYGKWLRNEGAEPHAIGAAMGHADSRMVERVYGRLAGKDLAKVLTAQVAPPVPLVSCDNADQGRSGATADAHEPAENPAKHGAQGRNRTADTGIFNPAADSVLPEESPENGVPCLNSVTDKAPPPVGVWKGRPFADINREPVQRLADAKPQPFPIAKAVAALEHCLAVKAGMVER